MCNMEWEDPIIAEIRRNREAYAAKFNYNIRAMVEDLRKLQAENGRVVVDLTQQPRPDYEAVTEYLKKAS